MEVQPLDLDHVVGLGERLVDVAPVEDPRPHGVRACVVVEDRLVLQRLLGVDEHGQRVVLDLDQISRVARELTGRRADGGDRLARVPNSAHRERVVLDVPARLDRHLEERIRVDRDLVAGDGPVHPVELERLRDVDRDDLRVRVRGADEVDVAHPVPADVVEEGAEALNEPLVLAPRDGLPDVALLEHLGSAASRRRSPPWPCNRLSLGLIRRSLPTATTASTMFT